MQQTTTSNQATHEDVLYQHTVKPVWGLALMAWERDGKRGYQFEDGKLRVFKNGYYHYLQTIDRPHDETERAIRELSLKLGRRRASKRLGADRVTIPLAEQALYFKDLFPKGLQGVKWAQKHRGIDAKKTLKRHRNSVITAAARLADRDALEARFEAGESLAILGELEELMRDTDMVTKAQLKGLERISEPVAEQMIRALINLVWGDDDVARRFNRWIGALQRALHRKPRWQLATVLPALFRPREHVCVKRTVFVKQAAWMAPSLRIPTAPTGAIYARALQMSRLLASKLEEMGLKTRDLIDVYDFVNQTLRPKAVKTIEARLAAGDEMAETDAESAAA
jgi:hypothetical protein